MENVISVLSWVWYNFFDRAAMFMMVLVLIGQLLTKRPVLESIMGALKGLYRLYRLSDGHRRTVQRLPTHYDGDAKRPGHEFARQ